VRWQVQTHAEGEQQPVLQQLDPTAGRCGAERNIGIAAQDQPEQPNAEIGIKVGRGKIRNRLWLVKL
jgi:hypothetical protein